jgi:para-nitrobenzyl esterase
MTGGSKEAFTLAGKVSQAWINFARSGNPSHPGLPVWEPYTQSNGSTMLLDNNCVLVHNHDKAVFEAIK